MKTTRVMLLSAVAIATVFAIVNRPANIVNQPTAVALCCDPPPVCFPVACDDPPPAI